MELEYLKTNVNAYKMVLYIFKSLHMIRRIIVTFL